jgi:hypothetical protein
LINKEVRRRSAAGETFGIFDVLPEMAKKFKTSAKSLLLAARAPKARLEPRQRMSDEEWDRRRTVVNEQRKVVAEKFGNQDSTPRQPA